MTFDLVRMLNCTAYISSYRLSTARNHVFLVESTSPQVENDNISLHGIIHVCFRKGTIFAVQNVDSSTLRNAVERRMRSVKILPTAAIATLTSHVGRFRIA